jgi:hypothetical protein
MTINLRNACRLGLALAATGMLGLLPTFQANAAQSDGTMSAKGQFQTKAATASSGVIPRFDHVVIVMMENEDESSIIGDTADAPYINSLVSQGANFTDSLAVTHPSQPNYLAFFSGSTQGITDDSCPHTFSVDNLGQQLQSAGFTFTGYAEGMPSNGYTSCSYGDTSTNGFMRKHTPWIDFSNIPASSNLTYASFPTDYTQLPTVSWVTPNMCDDMHNCSIATGDTWLKNNIAAYVTWAQTHNSLLILTWDEDAGSVPNQIATVFVGANVNVGSYSEQITHYNVLRTLEDMYGLPSLGNAASATPITDVWSTNSATPDFGVSTSPSSLSLTQGTSTSDTVTVSSVDGFANPVTLSLAGVPAGVTASLSPTSVTPAANGSLSSTLTLTAANAATTGSATITINGVSGSTTHSQNVSLTVNAPVTATTDYFTDVHSGMAMNDPGSSLTSGTQLIQWPYQSDSNAQWTVTANSDGSNVLKNVYSGLCVTSTSNNATGASIDQATCNGSVSQNWNFVATGSGYELVSEYSGQCLNVQSQSTTERADLVQSTCNGNTNQQWTITTAN